MSIYEINRFDFDSRKWEPGDLSHWGYESGTIDTLAHLFYDGDLVRVVKGLDIVSEYFVLPAGYFDGWDDGNPAFPWAYGDVDSGEKWLHLYS